MVYNTSDKSCVGHSIANALTGQAFFGTSFSHLLLYLMHKNNKSSFDTIEKINDYLLANKSLPDGAIQAAADWMGRPIYVWQWPELYYGDWEKNGKTKALIPFRPGNTNIQKNVFLPNGPISAPDAQAIHLFALVWGTKEAPGGGHCEFLVDEAAPLNSVSNLNLLQLFANNSDSIF